MGASIWQQTFDEGRAEGRACALLKLMRMRFGQVDAATQARVSAADAATLDDWIERVLTSESVEALLDG